MRSRLPFAVYPAAILLLVALHLWAASGVSPFAATRALLVWRWWWASAPARLARRSCATATAAACSRR